MSFLLDPPALYLAGHAYGRLAPERGRGPVATSLGAGTLATFVGTSASLYLNRAWTRPLWRLFRARDGRDWMLRSGVLPLDARRAGRRTHALAALLFATYPAWLALGYRRGTRARRLRG